MYASTMPAKRLSFRFRSGVWLLPAWIQLADADTLVWAYGPRTSARLAGRGGGLEHRADFLMAFLKLADAVPQDVLAFARRWGVLDPCGHQLCTHTDCVRRKQGPVPEGMGSEDLAWWRTLAGEARALFRGASSLRRGERLSAADRQRLDEAAEPGAFEESVSGDRALVTAFINQWSADFDVRPWVFWAGNELDDRPTVTLPGATLAGALASELLLHLTTTDQLATCDACGRPYSPSRRQRFDRRSFCRECGRSAAVRAAKRDYRQRRNYGMRLLSQGSRSADVALIVGVRLATVKRWAAEQRRIRTS